MNLSYPTTKVFHYGGKLGRTQSPTRSHIVTQAPLKRRSVLVAHLTLSEKTAVSKELRLILLQNVLIVGYQASGFDISTKIAPFVSRLWVSSTRMIADELPQGAIKMAGVEAFHPRRRLVRFTDGQYISEVDYIIFCTGYQYHQPFIKMNNISDEPLFPSGLSIENLHEHIIYIEKPTLAFVGMVKDAVPTFLVVQAQAAFVSRFFSDLIRSLSPRKEDPQHRLPYPLFMDYLFRLEILCEQADEGRSWNGTQGNNPIFCWTLELDLIRTKRREIRGAFMSHNQARTGIWTTADAMHEYHCQFLTMSAENVRSLVPFLILYHGYKYDHESKPTLPFQGWEDSLNKIIFQSVIDSYHTLPDILGQESSDLLSRGTKTLLGLILNRWFDWARRYYTMDQCEDWQAAFEKSVSLNRKLVLTRTGFRLRKRRAAFEQ